MFLFAFCPFDNPVCFSDAVMPLFLGLDLVMVSLMSKEETFSIVSSLDGNGGPSITESLSRKESP